VSSVPVGVHHLGTKAEHFVVAGQSLGTCLMRGQQMIGWVGEEEGLLNGLGITFNPSFPSWLLSISSKQKCLASKSPQLLVRR
jgi:hypothetical protein